MHSFSSFIQNESWLMRSLLDLSYKTLLESNIQALMLDFDGVLAPCGAVAIDPSLGAKLVDLYEKGIFIGIHSNNDKRLELARKSILKKDWPQFIWMPSTPKKPNPQNIKVFCAEHNIDTISCAMVDDRLYTGGKAAYLAGAQFIYISDPIIDLKNHFVYEVAFLAIRYLERLICPMPYKKWNCAREDSNL